MAAAATCPLGLGGDQVADTRRQIELDVGAAECAERATWTTNELVTTYRSLTQIAFAMTGTQWSGPRMP
jgi:hypothetical protein